MINPLHITKLVRDTLSDMEVYTPTMEILIKGTFLMESNLENLYSVDGYRHGLMMMRYDDIETIAKDYVKFKPLLKKNIITATGIDLSTEDVNVIIYELDSNIRLMVAMLYAFYNNRNEDLPEDKLETIAMYYRKNYDVDKTTSVEDFVDYYKKVFIN